MPEKGTRRVAVPASLFAAVLVAGGCAVTRVQARPVPSALPTPAPAPPAAARGAPRLTAILWHPVRGGAVEERAWLLLRGKGRARAYDGCNSGSGSWERAKDGTILLRVRRWTRRRCRGPDSVDLGLQERLAFRWQGELLEGRGPDGRPLVFRAAGASAPAELGGTWLLSQVTASGKALRTALANLRRLNAALTLEVDPSSLGYRLSVPCVRRPGFKCLEQSGIVNRRRDRLFVHRLSSRYAFDPASEVAESLGEALTGESRFLLLGDRLELTRDGITFVLRRQKHRRRP